MRPRRIGIGFAVAAALLALLVALAPGLLTQFAAAQISRALGVDVHLGWLSWNPFVGRWTVSQVRVAADRGPPAFAARRIAARLRVLDVIRGNYRVESMELDGARVRVRRTPDGLALPLPRRAAGETESGTPSPNISFDAVEAPRAVIRLEPLHGKPSRIHLRQLHVGASVDAGVTRLTMWSWGRFDRAPVSIVGRIRSSADSQRVRLRLATSNVDLARTLALTGSTPAREIGGRVDVKAKYEESGPTGSVQRTVSGVFTARELTLRSHGAEAFRVRHVTVSRFVADLGRLRLSLGDLRLRGPEVWVRAAGSRLTVPGLFGEGEAAADTPQWTVTVASVDVAGGAVHHVDKVSGESRLEVAVERAHAGPVAASDAPVPFSVIAGVGSAGRIAAQGDVTREPIAARTHVDVTDVVLPPLAALVGAPVRLESGKLTGALDLAFAHGVAEGSGTLTVADVKTISPDDSRPEDVMAFKEVRLAIRRMQTEPPAATLDTVDIDWPYVLVDRTPAGIFPLSLASSPAAGPPASRAAAPKVLIGRLRILGGRIDFRDATLEPPYWRALASLNLDARRVEAPGLRIASLQAKGLVDEISPLRVEGTVGDRARVVAEVDRLDLLPFNAYLQGAAPYIVASGLLTLRSEITLDRSQLEVNNHVVLSRFGLAGGEGDDFVKREVGIPLTLALALMKDYRGNIALALPFGGDLKQPVFEMRSVILQAIVSAVRGAVMSPLNALGRVLVQDGRIEQIDLEPVPFPPGTRQLDDLGRERLVQVARVLQTHPALAVRFRGLAAAADVERIQDEAALSALVNEQGVEPLRAFLRARLDGRTPPSLEREQKARLDALLAGLPWPGANLNALALDRGSVAVAGLVLDHKVDPERVAAETPEIPGLAQLGPVPGASVELHEQ